MANLKEIWGAGADLDGTGARIGGEKRPFRDFQPPDYDPRQRRRTDEAGFAPQQVYRTILLFSHKRSHVTEIVSLRSGMTRMGTI